MIRGISEKIKALAVESLSKYNGDRSKTYDWDEISKHNTKTDFWTVVNGYVYDLTAYLAMHPGGFNLLFRLGGQNATNDFEAMFHSRNAKLILEEFCIGRVKGYKPIQSRQLLGVPPFQLPNNNPFNNNNSQQMKSIISSNNNESSSITTTNPIKLFNLKIKTKQSITTDTWMFELELPKLYAILGWCDPLTHVALYNDRNEFTSYTPIGHNDQSLYFLIKGYENGNISKYLVNKKVGDWVQMKGPLPTTSSEFDLVTFTLPFLVCIVGGTGITPIIQIINRLSLKTPQNNIHIILVYSNQRSSDILYKQQFEQLQQTHLKHHLTIYHILTKETQVNYQNGISNEYYCGQRINFDILSKIFTKHPQLTLDNNMVLVCGPKEFNNSINDQLETIGYNSNKVIILE